MSQVNEVVVFGELSHDDSCCPGYRSAPGKGNKEAMLFPEMRIRRAGWPSRMANEAAICENRFGRQVEDKNAVLLADRCDNLPSAISVKA